MKDMPIRKPSRLEGYDYSQNGAYFVTLCVEDRRELMGEVVVGSGFHARPSVELTDLGLEVRKTINFNAPIMTALFATKMNILQLYNISKTIPRIGNGIVFMEIAGQTCRGGNLPAAREHRIQRVADCRPQTQNTMVGNLPPVAKITGGRCGPYEVYHVS